MPTIADCLPFTLQAEGGYTKNSSDSGNWTNGEIGRGFLVGTNLGVSAPVWGSWLKESGDHSPVTADMMKSLTVNDVTPLYAAKYWNPILGDQLPPGVCLSAFDMQVNAGSNGARCLQAAVGLTGKDVDGWVGPETLAAISKIDTKSLLHKPSLSQTAIKAIQSSLKLTVDGVIGPKTLSILNDNINLNAILISAIMYDKQETYYKNLNNPTFIKGWLNRCETRLNAALNMIINLHQS